MKPKTWAGVVALALAAASCAESSPTGTGEQIEHPTGADALVLQVDYTGGLVPVEYTFSNVPAFALFGDGTAIVPGAQAAIYPGPALPALFARSLSEEGMQTVLRAALDAGLGQDATHTDLGSMGIADASTTVFTLSAQGRTAVVQVYALGFEGSTKPEGMPQDEFDARVRLLGFLESIGDIATLVPEGSLGEEGPYAGEAARLLVQPAGRPDPELPQEPAEWPLSEPLTAFGDPYEALGTDARCGVIEGEDWVKVHALARGANQQTPWVSRARRFTLVFRPLLPSEAGC